VCQERGPKGKEGERRKVIKAKEKRELDLNQSAKRKEVLCERVLSSTILEYGASKAKLQHGTGRADSSHRLRASI